MQDATLFSPNPDDLSQASAQAMLAESDAVLRRLAPAAPAAALPPELLEHICVAWLRKINALHALRRYEEAIAEVEAMLQRLAPLHAETPVGAWPWLAQAACRRVTALGMSGELPSALAAAEEIQERYKHADGAEVREWVAFAGLQEIRLRATLGATFARVDMVRFAQQLADLFKEDLRPATRALVGQIQIEKAELLAVLDYTDDALNCYDAVHDELRGADEDALRTVAADALHGKARLLRKTGRIDEAQQALEGVIRECGQSEYPGMRHTLVIAQMDEAMWAEGTRPTLAACNRLLQRHADHESTTAVVTIIVQAMGLKAATLAELADEIDAGEEDDEDQKDEDQGGPGSAEAAVDLNAGNVAAEEDADSVRAQADSVAEALWTRYAHYPDERVQARAMGYVLDRIAAWDAPKRVLAASDRILSAFEDTSEQRLFPAMMRALLAKSEALRMLDRSEEALLLLDRFEPRFNTAEGPALQAQRANAMLERARVFRNLDRFDDAARTLAQAGPMLDAIGDAAGDATLRARLARALDERVDLLADATPPKHPLQEKGKDEAGADLRLPLDETEQAYADAVGELLERFGTDTYRPIRARVAHTVYNLAVHQRERLHIDDALGSYTALLDHFKDDTDTRTESFIASAYLNRAYLWLNLQGDNEKALADYDALMQRFANAATPGMRDTLARAAASRLTCLNRMQREGKAVNYGDQYEQVTLEQRDELEATINRGIELSKKGKHRAAVAAFDELLEKHIESLHPELRRQCLDALVRKAYSLSQAGDREAALAANNEVIARYGSDLSTTIEKDVALAMSNKAANLRNLDRRAEAAAVSGEIIDRWQDSNLDYFKHRVAKAMFDQGYDLQEHDKERALALFRQAARRYLRESDVAVRGEAVKSQLNIGVLLRKNGRYAEAIEACKTLLDACAADTDKGIRENLVMARICMGRSHAAAGDKREAVQIFQQVLALPADAMEANMRSSIQKELLEAGGGVLRMIGNRFKDMFQRK